MRFARSWLEAQRRRVLEQPAGSRGSHPPQQPVKLPGAFIATPYGPRPDRRH